MSTESDFRDLLLGAPAVAALVQDRVALGALPVNPSWPHVVYNVAHEPTRSLSDALGDQAMIECTVWDSTPDGAAALADAIVAAIEAAPKEPSVTVLSRATTFDEDIDRDGVLLVIEWWV